MQTDRLPKWFLVLHFAAKNAIFGVTASGRIEPLIGIFFRQRVILAINCFPLFYPNLVCNLHIRFVSFIFTFEVKATTLVPETPLP